jgi:oligosaccharyltransferase complex subunit alpha (ribophorin I)
LQRQEPPWSFRELRALLPSGAERIYYRDQIGNISSSDVLHLRNGVELSLAMRFPLMGGWKTQFYQGYNVPVQVRQTDRQTDRQRPTTSPLRTHLNTHMHPSPQDLLTASGRRRTLRVRFSVPFPDMWVRDLTVKVVLPEYAHNVQVQLPFEVDEQVGSHEVDTSTTHVMTHRLHRPSTVSWFAVCLVWCRLCAAPRSARAG